MSRKKIFFVSVLLAFILCSCTSPVPTAKPVEIAPTTWIAVIKCDECADAGMKINIWKEPSAQRILAFSVSNNTKAEIIDHKCNEGTCYYKVKITGNTGWIMADFIQK